MRILTFAAGCAVLLVLTACTETAPKKKAEEAPPEPVTGRSALWKMYQAGRAWAPDIEILKLNSIHLPEVKAEPGKAAAWQVTFVSPSRARARGWTFSVVESEGNLHKGVFAGLEEGWSGPRGITQPFPIAALKVDTDQVYKTALTKAAAYEKKNPGKTITFQLESTKRHPEPAWRVIWGESVGTSNFSILVGASTGLYLETMR